jgi:hypothetical protein
MRDLIIQGVDNIFKFQVLKYFYFFIKQREKNNNLLKKAKGKKFKS